MFLKFSLSVISLCRYPNLVLMDATYKTCKLALRLFFLVVHMNVGYSVVAEFIIQHEDTTSITEALKILRKRWDECDIEVGNFMIDCQQLEENAIRAVFPDSVVIKPDTPINIYTQFCLNTAKSKFSLVSPVADW